MFGEQLVWLNMETTVIKQMLKNCCKQDSIYLQHISILFFLSLSLLCVYPFPSVDQNGERFHMCEVSVCVRCVHTRTCVYVVSARVMGMLHVHMLTHISTHINTEYKIYINIYSVVDLLQFKSKM